MTRIPRSMLLEEVTIERFTGATATGNAYATPETGVRARVEPVDRLATDRQGRQVAVERVVLLRPEVAPVPIESRVTIAGDAFRVIRSGAYPDERRPKFRELALGYM